MKVLKDEILSVKLSTEEKKRFEEYARDKYVSQSAAARGLIMREVEKWEKQKEKEKLLTIQQETN